MQRCGRCKHEKPLDEFSPSYRGKVGTWCRQCFREYQRGEGGSTPYPERPCSVCGRLYRPKLVRVKNHAGYCSRECKEAARKASGRMRASHLRKKFGITVEDYDRILEAQGGGCAICDNSVNRNSPSRLYMHIDHDHKTGRIRGVLCDRCNQAIGHFEDDPALLRRAADYLDGT
jgi:hypothetical protein